MKPSTLFNKLMSFIGLMLFWLVMSGMLQPMQIGQGVICAVIVIAINHKLKEHKFYDDEVDDLRQLRFFHAIWYVVWLVKEMILAGLHVAGVILSPSGKMEPTIIKFRVDLPSAHAKMILGNSITLTPGTVTIDIEGDRFTVHGLSRNSYGGIIDDSMPRMVLKLFEKETRQVVHDIEIITREDQLPRS